MKSNDKEMWYLNHEMHFSRAIEQSVKIPVTPFM